jgi:hypothetical protein
VAKRLRLRAHVEAPPKDDDDQEQAPARPLADRARHFARRRALFLHVVVDALERPVAVLVREVFDGWTRREILAVPDGTEPTSDMLLWAATQFQDLRRGFLVTLDVLTFSDLGLLLVSRCYRFGVPLVGWDLAWQLCRLAGHVGRAEGGAFSVALLGTGVVVDGKWTDSDFCPRLRVTSRGSGSSAFVRWLAPRDRSAMPRGHRPQFVDLRNLTATVVGGEVGDLAAAADLLKVEWPR